MPGRGTYLSPWPVYYFVGGVLAGAGILLLAMRTRLRPRPDARPRARLAVAVFALAAGLVVFGAGLWLDAERSRQENTMSLWYHVSVRMNGTGAAILSLPAPGDERFFDVLNVTNGSSTLRLSHTATEASVVVTAYGNVSFEVLAEAYPLGNWSFTRVTYVAYGPQGPTWNATIGLRTSRPEASVLLNLDASLGTFCLSHGLEVDATIQEGVGDYPATAPGIVC